MNLKSLLTLTLLLTARVTVPAMYAAETDTVDVTHEQSVLKLSGDFPQYLMYGYAHEIWSFVDHIEGADFSDFTLTTDPDGVFSTFSPEEGVDLYTVNWDAPLGQVKITISYKGESVAGTVTVIPNEALSYGFYDANAELIDCTPLDNIGGNIYQATITVPEGGISFMLRSPEYPEVFTLCPQSEGDVTLDLDGDNNSFALANGNNGYLWIIPGKYAGRTFNVRAYPYRELLMFYTDGFDPDRIDIAAVEGNPATLAAGTENMVRYLFKTHEGFNLNIESDNGNAWWTNQEWTEEGIIFEICVRPDSEGEIHLTFRNDNGGVINTATLTAEVGVLMLSDQFPRMLRRGTIYNIWEFVKQIEGVDPYSLTVTTEPGDVLRLEDLGEIYVVVNEDAPCGEITVTITAANGKTVSGTTNVVPSTATCYMLYNPEGYVYEDTTLNDCGNGSFEGSFTVPEGGMTFYLADPSFGDFYMAYPESEEYVAVNVEQGVANVRHAGQNTGLYWSIPESAAGQTVNVRLDNRTGTVIFYTGDINPFTVEVTPDENNPTTIPVNREGEFVFTVKSMDWVDCNPQMDGGDSWISYQYNIEGGMICHIVVRPWSEGSGQLSLINNATGETMYTCEIQSQYIPVESISIPESITVLAGEHYSFTVDVQPAVSSEDVWMDLSDDRSFKAFSNDGKTYYVVATDEGQGIIYFTCTNGMQQEVRVEVLPADAGRADHIFHAHIQKDQSLPLFVEFPGRDADDVEWTSSDTGVAIVENGVVKGVKDGTAVLTATKGDSKAMIGVRVGNYSGETSGTDDIETARSVKVYSHNGTAYITGAAAGTEIRAFDVNGRAVATARSMGGTTRMTMHKGVNIITVGGETFKIAH